MTKKENTASTAEVRRLKWARSCVRDLIETYPRTVEGRLKQIRRLQEFKVKLVCEAFASSEPEAIFRYAPPHPGLDPKLIHSNLDAFIKWALKEPEHAPKDNQIRDEAISAMVMIVLLNTNLKSTRNLASHNASACSFVAEILREYGIKASEPLVENAWKKYAKELKPAVARILSSEKTA